MENITLNKRILIAVACTLIAVSGLIIAGCNNNDTSKSGKNNNLPTNFTPTDYSSPDNWYMNDFANQDKAETKADVIFFTGTCAKKADQENMVGYINDEMKSSFAKLYVSGASAFEEGTRMYLPYYRQISLENAIELTDHNDLLERISQTEVGTDICAALDHYFKNYNNGRPFIIAGASQGGASVQIALEHYFGHKDNRKYLNQMVAAYSIAYGVDKNFLNKLNYLKFAEGATDTGVVISWVTEGTGCTEKDMLVANNPTDNLVINPINWKRDYTYASASECISTLKGDQIVKPGIYNLQFNPDRGCLVCDNNTDYIQTKKADGSVVWGGKSLHKYEA